MQKLNYVKLIYFQNAVQHPQFHTMWYKNQIAPGKAVIA